MPKRSDVRLWAACGVAICIVIALLSGGPDEIPFAVYLSIQAVVGAALGALAAVIRNWIARQK